MDNTSLQDILIRSRVTILDLLDARGYETAPYRKIIGSELVKLINAPDALRIIVKSKTEPTKTAIVEYELGNIKQAVVTGAYVKSLIGEDSTKGLSMYMQDPKMTEIMVIYMTKSDNSSDDIESLNKGALEAWTKHNLKIQFFLMVRLVNNPLKHVLQPKFEIVPNEQHGALMGGLYIKSKSQLPVIRFHDDPVARCLGLVPLDIVKITRPSPTAGEYVEYRVCAP
jgi:DNA-directed RNA polymerase subunit H (RpoH/RPB5)